MSASNSDDGLTGSGPLAKDSVSVLVVDSDEGSTAGLGAGTNPVSLMESS
ncbi:MAG: hypothetical protein ACRBK7_06645 [Acidimicrobiales bacterium]